uniref:Uncharacterized protein n=1 Tax=Triatoma infestans TaxID=30076 RepID=A0A170XPE2_TRIIF
MLWVRRGILSRNKNIRCYVRGDVLIVEGREFGWSEEKGIVCKDQEEEAYLKNLLGEDEWWRCKAEAASQDSNGKAMTGNNK